MNTTNQNVVRINITVPKQTLADLEKTIPNGRKSKFIADAIEEKLRRERRERAMEELKKLPPANPEIQDAAKYIHDMRRADDRRRAKKLGI